MARAHVTDLVPEHGLELCLVIEVVHDAARDVDVAAAGREGVDLVAVEHRKRVRQLRTLARLGGALAHFIDVRSDLLVVVHAAELLQQHRVHFFRLGDLAGFALEHQIRCASDGIRRAASEAGSSRR
jgi:hypothetical protein